MDIGRTKVRLRFFSILDLQGDSIFMYDYLIDDSGLYGVVCAPHLTDASKSVLVVDKRLN